MAKLERTGEDQISLTDPSSGILRIAAQASP